MLGSGGSCGFRLGTVDRTIPPERVEAVLPSVGFRLANKVFCVCGNFVELERDGRSWGMLVKNMLIS